MRNFDRRELLHSGIALALPLGGMSLFGGQESTGTATNDGAATDSKKESKKKDLQVQYLEIVTPKVEELCQQYSAMHGVKFGEPIPSFGNARTAKLNGGGMIGIRAPMRETETPVVRPYMLVENLEKAVAAAKDSGAEIAIPKMEIPGGHGSIAIVILGGIECGMWQL